ncbi:response regulator transcription factor [Verrucomicrobium sp. BvORR106]|uniref:response regulator transcription factor n=1 Tax=Verrucomicrobium sp. BvORR106 TaxID=1403819 RepID=UPI00056EE7F2|nr:response regulator transcription factor [Verrucomicrobium sp. BvORR106]
MRVLVVEDDPDLRRSLAATLREENYAVDIAADGGDGLDKAKQNAYDIILLDVMLPELSGWEILQQLRPANTTPVLMLTARDAVHDRVKGLNQGADDYLTKPFDIEELLARIRALIRRAAGQTLPVLTIRDLSIDTASRKVLLKGEDIPVTAREYALVEYLALHQGEVVSRTTLYEHLFDEDDSTLSNLLDVHVSNLRKKLGPEVITTRRGHGYCIE